MSSRIADIFIVLVLAVLAWQDFRTRSISWWLLPLLFIALGFSGQVHAGWPALGRYFAINLFFLILQLALIWSWFVLRHRRLLNIIDRQIGLGDILFLLCISLAFSTINFLFFYTASLVLVLLFTLAKRLFSSTREELIPLAGAVAVPMLLLCLARFFEPAFDLYNDHWLSGWLTNLSTP